MTDVLVIVGSILFVLLVAAGLIWFEEENKKINKQLNGESNG